MVQKKKSQRAPKSKWHDAFNQLLRKIGLQANMVGNRAAFWSEEKQKIADSNPANRKRMACELYKQVVIALNNVANDDKRVNHSELPTFEEFWKPLEHDDEGQTISASEPHLTLKSSVTDAVITALDAQLRLAEKLGDWRMARGYLEMIAGILMLSGDWEDAARHYVSLALINNRLADN